MKVRFPTEQIREYHNNLEEIRNQISEEYKITPEQQIFIRNNQIFDPLLSNEKEDLLLDLMFCLSGKYVICSKRLQKLASDLGFIAMVTPESEISIRQTQQINYKPRFYDVNHIYHNSDELKEKAISWSKEFLDPFQKYKHQRLEKIQSLCHSLQRDQLVISTFNKPYLVLFKNFVESCDRHAINIRDRAIMFPMDSESYEACKELEVAAYYEEDVYGPTTSIHRGYGDQYFRNCMFMKNAVVQDMLSLGYNILFQDIDMVWLKDPFPYLSKLARLQSYDYMFMFDGGNPRFQPLYYNSGFFYIVNNPFSKQAWQIFYDNFDVIYVYKSQQVPLNIILNAFRESGLRTHLLDENLFLNGHRITPDGENRNNVRDETLVVHVSWTGNLEFKLKKLKENGLWFLGEDL